jgi:hypothetical protein
VEAELHFYGGTTVDVADLIAELVHKENSASSTLTQSLRAGWVGKLFVVESMPLVRNANGEAALGLY